MGNELNGKRVAALVAQGFEQVELIDPKQALEAAGAKVDIISPEQGRVRGWNHTDWGTDVPVDEPIDAAEVSEYDALLLPGGVMSPDRLRTNEKAVTFVREFMKSGKPVAAICHGPWTLVEADCVRGYRVTSYPSIKTDLRNAGANWVNEQVVVDRGLVTSREPGDIPAFNQKMIEEFKEGVHRQRAEAAHARS
jgi:protease I